MNGNRTRWLRAVLAGIGGVSLFAAVTALLLAAAAPFIRDYDSLLLFDCVVLFASVTGLLAARYGIVRIEQVLRNRRSKVENSAAFDESRVGGVPLS